MVSRAWLEVDEGALRRNLRRGTRRLEERAELSFHTADADTLPEFLDAFFRLHEQRCREEREGGGYPIWVAGPALVHSRARADMVWFVRNGFVKALLESDGAPPRHNCVSAWCRSIPGCACCIR